MAFTIHATRKLLERVKQPVGDPVEASTVLGNWYANVLSWRPQVALLVSESTLLPVFVPLAPARTMALRFPEQLALVLDRIGAPKEFVTAEVAAMGEGSFAKTANRSVLGSMNDFAYLAGFHRDAGNVVDLVALSASMAETPCSPLFASHTSPDREVLALVEGSVSR